MKRLALTGIILAALMFVATALAVVLRPMHMDVDKRQKIDLESMIPKQFGDWRIDESIVPIMPAPDVQEVLSKTYSQTLSRTYINGLGYRVMLSIAYGSEQGDSMNYHRPDVCYPSQGFEVSTKSSSILNFGDRKIEAQKMLASQPRRVEPLIYWVVIGDWAADYGLRRKLAAVRYGLTGVIPDGLLFRVSAVDHKVEESFEKQITFLEDLYGALGEQERRRFFGAVESRLGS